MECPNCGTWNPDDKTKCWRCSTELPQPPEPKKRRQVNSQTWVWILAIVFFVLTTLVQCGVIRFGGDSDSAGLLWNPGFLLAHSLL